MAYWRKIEFITKGVSGKTKAFVKLHFAVGQTKDDYFVMEINGGKIIEGPTGNFFSFPQQKGGERWYSIINPVAKGRDYFTRGEKQAWMDAMKVLSDEILRAFDDEFPNGKPEEAADWS